MQVPVKMMMNRKMLLMTTMMTMMMMMAMTNQESKHLQHSHPTFERSFLSLVCVTFDVSLFITTDAKLILYQLYSVL